MTGWKRVIALLSVLLMIAFLGAGCRLFGREEPGPAAETENEDVSFTATDMFTGETIAFPADFADKVVYLVFFSNG